MSDAAVAVNIKSARTSSAAMSRGLLLLLVALGMVLGCRLLLYAWMPNRTSDFDGLYQAAVNLVQGKNPYPMATRGFPYPLPAVLLAVPFTIIPLGLARPIFDVLVGWVFAYALWKYRGSYALLALLSGAYLFALGKGETTPLMVAASLLPAMGFLFAVRPNTSAALWVARPTWTALLGVGLFFALSLVITPTWPRDWWNALPSDSSEWIPPIMRPLGFILLLAVLRWRLPEGRLLLAIPFLPQTFLPYELVSLALVPANLLEMGIYVAGSWIVVAAAADWLHLSPRIGEWPVALCAVYLPMLYLVLRRTNGRSATPIEKERRRPHRLPDDELEVDVTPNDDGGITAKVTHVPTRLSATESGKTRDPTVRKAQDKLAAILARTSRLRRKA